MNLNRLIVLVVLVALGLGFAAMPGAAQTTPTLTVTPDANLADGDVVTLVGSDFTETGQVGFCQGIVGAAPSPSNCDGWPSTSRIGFANVNESGEFSAQYTVRRFISSSGIGTVDCAQPSAGCVIGAANLSGGFSIVGPGATVPLTFTPLPPPSVTVTPDDGLVDGDVVTVAGTSFPRSSQLVICEGVFSGSFSSSECGAPSESASTDDSGAFSAQYTVRRFISASPGAPLTIDCAAPSANCAIGALSAVTPIAFASQPPPGPLFGTVTDPDGDPVAGTDVWAYTPSDGFVGSLQTTTSAQGSYAFNDAELGVPYRVLFLHPSGSTLASEWFDNEATRQTATVVTPMSGVFGQANAQLEEAGSISGTVTNAQGNPLAGVTVSAFGPGDTWFGSYPTSTAADGSYMLTNVRSTEYGLLFVPPAGSGLVSEWYDNARTRGSATTVGVEGQAVTGIDIQLGEAGAISGAVTDADGNPVSGVTVGVYGPGDGYAASYRSVTAADGTYLIQRMLPGDQYLVRFGPPVASGLAAEWYDNAPLRATAQNISLTAGQTVTGIDAALEPST
jgi:hypothetical protein